MPMDVKKFIDDFAGQFDDADGSVFAPETKFHELDSWSSLVALSIIAMVDEEYGVTLRGDDIKNSATIQELFEVVQARKK